MPTAGRTPERKVVKNKLRKTEGAPRCVMVDLGPTVVDEVRAGTCQHLLRPEDFDLMEDAAKKIARGFHTIGRAMRSPLRPKWSYPRVWKVKSLQKIAAQLVQLGNAQFSPSEIKLMGLMSWEGGWDESPDPWAPC